LRARDARPSGLDLGDAAAGRFGRGRGRAGGDQQNGEKTAGKGGHAWNLGVAAETVCIITAGKLTRPSLLK
jgi:hypothetical protein